MKLTAISDTHGRHRDVIINDGDIIIHAGDFLAKSNSDHLTDFCSWHAALDFRFKILISGNHDRYRLRKPGEFVLPVRMPDR